MNIEHYIKFKEYEDNGLKKEASTSFRAFISSFDNENQIKNWVWEYLPKLETNRHSRIRHELFCELVYPVLKSGYDNNDFLSTLWLGKLAQNIYQTQQIHAELDWVTELDLYNKCHDINPEDVEARLLLLETIVNWLAYSEHEWPSGLLYGNNGATIEECDNINAEVQRVIQLDKERKYSEFIEQYVKKLNEYRERLNKSF